MIYIQLKFPALRPALYTGLVNGPALRPDLTPVPEPDTQVLGHLGKIILILREDIYCYKVFS